jgi:LysR family positive regulator for ilvC
VGSSLFNRNNRTVEITTAGLLFKEYCEEQVSRWEFLQDRIGSASRTITGLVRIYCSVTASHSILSDVLAPIKTNHPGISISLETGPSELTFQKIQNYEADIGLTSLPEILPKEIRSKRIRKLPLSLIVPQTRSLEDIMSNKLPFIYPKSGLAKTYMMKWFERKNIIPKIYAEVSGFEGLMTLVSLGYGASVVPQLVYDTNPLKSTIDILRLEVPIQTLQLGICCKKKKTYLPAVNVFFNLH